MTEPSSPLPNKKRHARRHAEPVRRNRPSRFAWARTTGGMTAIGAGVLLLAVVVRLAVGGDDSKTESKSPVGPALTTYGTDWRTKDGHSYEITVTPIGELVSAASPSGCIGVPGTGRTNLRFTVRIDNLGTEQAPVPEIRFATNLKASGAVSSAVSFEKASTTNIDINQPGVSDCDRPGVLRGGDEPIGAKSAATYTGLIGGVRTPVGTGVSLFVRYTQADAAAPSGSSTADFVVRFPDVR